MKTIFKESNEKLKELFRLAFENGFETIGDPDGYSISDYEYGSTLSLIERRVAPGNEPYIYQVSTLIFDHDFIDALCKAKYGKDDDDMVNLRFSSSILSELALTEPEERVNSLYRDFIEKK